MRGDEFIKGELVEYMAIEVEVDNREKLGGCRLGSVAFHAAS